MHYWKNKQIQQLNEAELRNGLTEAIETIEKLQNELHNLSKQATQKRVIKKNCKSW